MSKIKSCLVLGEPCTGKTTSLKNLNPEETFIINVINKGLPFKNKYKKVSEDFKTGNYFVPRDWQGVISALKVINDQRKDIKTIIIDDFHFLMSNEFFSRATETGFGKFVQIGQHIWLILNKILELRDDLFCFIMSHSIIDENGRMKAKTIGKMLDTHMSFEGIFPLVLHSVVQGVGAEKSRYFLQTNTDEKFLARSPMNLFEKYIDNDLDFVKKKIEAYYIDSKDNLQT